MQKVYLLLRHNQQTGPFSLEELIRFDLKPFDLIWIEGKSAGWYYPQEIQALHPYLTFLKQPDSKNQNATPVHTTDKPRENSFQTQKVYVSMPSYTKEEPIPKPSLADYHTEKPKISEPAVSKTETEESKISYSKNLQEVETDYMNWLYQKKKPAKGPSFLLRGLLQPA